MYVGGMPGGQHGDVSFLQSEMNTGIPSGSVTFAYILSGGATLTVSNIFNYSKPQTFMRESTEWSEACLELSSNPATQITFSAVTGNSVETYVALDDISLSMQKCPIVPNHGKFAN